MKNTKKLLAVLLAVVMVLGLSVSAFAVEGKNDSITVKDTKVGETYNLYKLFNLDVDDENDPNAYSYSVNEAWREFFDSDGAKYIEENEDGYVTAIYDNNGEVAEDAEDLAKAAKDWANSHKDTLHPIDSKVANDTTVVFEDLDNGYYLITSTLGTVAMTETTPSAQDVTVKEKNPEDTIKKEVKEDSTDTWGKSNDAQIGDTVDFKSTATLLPNTTNVKIHDTMTEGLTYNNDAKVGVLTTENGEEKIVPLNEGPDYYVTSEGDDTFTIVFTQDYLDSLKETTTLVVTYSAVLNQNAVVVNNETGEPAINEQTNKTDITFGDKQSKEDETKTTTHKFEVLKYDGADEEQNNLADAVFHLKKGGEIVKLIQIDDTNYRVANGDEAGAVDTFTTVEDGNIVIWGVDADDDYTLEEIEAPAGYNLAKEEFDVEVDASNETVVEVENNTGSELPSTGGIGTTIFTIVGSVLVLGAAVLLIAKKRTAAEE